MNPEMMMVLQHDFLFQCFYRLDPYFNILRICYVPRALPIDLSNYKWKLFLLWDSYIFKYNVLSGLNRQFKYQTEYGYM